MTDDIVKVLRARAAALDAYHDIDEMRVVSEAAAEIERLRHEVKRLTPVHIGRVKPLPITDE
jgi:hypothetical protein